MAKKVHISVPKKSCTMSSYDPMAINTHKFMLMTSPRFPGTSNYNHIKLIINSRKYFHLNPCLILTVALNEILPPTYFCTMKYK